MNENDEKEPIDIEFTKQKADLVNDKNYLTKGGKMRKKKIKTMLRLTWLRA